MAGSLWTAQTRAHSVLCCVFYRGFRLSEQQLRDYFSQFGPLTDVYLPKHRSGRVKGFGFCTFESEADLNKVLQVRIQGLCPPLCAALIAWRPLVNVSGWECRFQIMSSLAFSCVSIEPGRDPNSSPYRSW